jgi:hypothetical protein
MMTLLASGRAGGFAASQYHQKNQSTANEAPPELRLLPHNIFLLSCRLRFRVTPTIPNTQGDGLITRWHLLPAVIPGSRCHICGVCVTLPYHPARCKCTPRCRRLTLRQFTTSSCNRPFSHRIPKKSPYYSQARILKKPYISVMSRILHSSFHPLVDWHGRDSCHQVLWQIILHGTSCFSPSTGEREDGDRIRHAEDYPTAPVCWTLTTSFGDD